MEFKPKPDSDRRRASMTWYTDFRRLQSDPHGVLLVCLMEAANDIYLASWSASRYEPINQDQLPPFERHLRTGADQYFMRLVSGHLNEGMSLIQEFNQNPLLVSAVERLPENCRCAHEELCACLKGGSESDYFRTTVGQLRHKTAFHYDPKTTGLAVNYLAERPQPVPAKITMGGDAYLTRFNLADAVLEVVLTRKVLRIEAGKNVDEELRPFAEFLNRKCIAFVLFVKSFITAHLTQEWA